MEIGHAEIMSYSIHSVEHTLGKSAMGFWGYVLASLELFLSILSIYVITKALCPN